MIKYQTISKEKKRKIDINSQKGITLIALVVTIILLLIISGVVISYLVGDEGVFKKAQKSVQEHEKAQAKDRIALEIIEADLEKSGNQLTFREIANKLISKGITTEEQVDESSNEIITKDGFLASITKNEIGKWEVEIISSKLEENIVVSKSMYPEASVTTPVEKLSVTAIQMKDGIKEITMPDGSKKTFNTLTTKYKTEYEVYYNGTFNFVIESNKGEKQTVSFNVTNVDVGAIAIVADNPEWTNQNIDVEVIWPENVQNLTKEISIDNGENYVQYTDKIQVGSNTTIKARLKHNTNVIKEAEPVQITKIDKELPRATINLTNYTVDNIVWGVNSTITSTDIGSGMDYNNSKYVLTKSTDLVGLNPSSYTDGTLTGETTTFTKGKSEGTYYLHILLKDNVGNSNEIVSNNSIAVAGRKNFSYSGSLQNFVIPMEGKYKLEIAGARGSGGNKYGTSYSPIGGNGAKMIAQFDFLQNDSLDLIIGGVGSCTQATARDGTSGGGGGGTFVFKRISTITDNRYQFTKGSQNYETLLVAAGGGGANDSAYQSKLTNGYNGIGSSYKSPNNFTAYSTTASTGSVNETMGISQFITNNAAGATYSRANGRAQGGYGCGGATDDSVCSGGGWCSAGTTGQATSWSLDTNATGTDGANAENGYAYIIFVD